MLYYYSNNKKRHQRGACATNTRRTLRYRSATDTSNRTRIIRYPMTGRVYHALPHLARGFGYVFSLHPFLGGGKQQKRWRPCEKHFAWFFMFQQSMSTKFLTRSVRHVNRPHPNPCHHLRSSCAGHRKRAGLFCVGKKRILTKMLTTPANHAILTLQIKSTIGMCVLPTQHMFYETKCQTTSFASGNPASDGRDSIPCPASKCKDFLCAFLLHPFLGAQKGRQNE